MRGDKSTGEELEALSARPDRFPFVSANMGGGRGRIRIGSPGWTIPMIRNLFLRISLKGKEAQKTSSIVVYTYITYGMGWPAFCFEEWNLS